MLSGASTEVLAFVSGVVDLYLEAFTSRLALGCSRADGAKGFRSSVVAVPSGPCRLSGCRSQGICVHKEGACSNPISPITSSLPCRDRDAAGSFGFLFREGLGQVFRSQGERASERAVNWAQVGAAVCFVLCYLHSSSFTVRLIATVEPCSIILIKLNVFAVMAKQHIFLLCTGVKL